MPFEGLILIISHWWAYLNLIFILKITNVWLIWWTISFALIGPHFILWKKFKIQNYKTQESHFLVNLVPNLLPQYWNSSFFSLSFLKKSHLDFLIKRLLGKTEWHIDSTNTLQTDYLFWSALILHLYWNTRFAN